MSPITITGMMLFQDANRLKMCWKEELSEELNKKCYLLLLPYMLLNKQFYLWAGLTSSKRNLQGTEPAAMFACFRHPDTTKMTSSSIWGANFHSELSPCTN